MTVNIIIMKSPLDTPFEMKREITRYVFLKTNYLKLLVYYFLNVVTLLFTMILINSNQEVRKFLYDEVDTIQEADFVFVYLEDKTTSMLAVSQKSIKTVPYLRPKTHFTVVYANRRFYYSFNNRCFKLIGNKFINLNIREPTGLQHFKSPLSEEEYKKLFDFYGKNTFLVEEIGFIRFLYEFTIVPLHFYNFLAILYFIFIKNELGYPGRLMLYLSIMFISRRYEYNQENENIKEACNRVNEVNVYRRVEGKIKKLRISDLYLTVGDIVEIENKQHIQFDCVLISGSCIVDQSTLTGESIPIIKGNVNENEAIRDFNRIYSGSKVLQTKSKTTIGVVSAIGFDSFQGNLISVMTSKKLTPFRFFEDMLILFSIVFVVLMAFFINMIVIEVMNDKFNFDRAIFIFVQLSLQSFPLSIYFSLFLVERFVAIQIKKHNLKKVSGDYIVKAGRMDLLCFDKTGTLTEDSLRLDSFLIKNGAGKVVLNSQVTSNEKDVEKRIVELMGCCHSLDVIDGNTLGDPLEKEIFDFAGFTLQSINDSVSADEEIEDFTKIEETMKDRKLVIKPNKEFTEKHGVTEETSYTIQKYIHFDSTRKRMSVVVESSDTQQKYLVYTKGAPEIVSELIIKETLPPDYESLINQYSKKGYRLLTMAYKETDDFNVKDEELENKLTFLGILVFVNPLKPGVRKTIRELQINRISTVMITGDAVNTAINVGYSSSIIPNHKSVWLGQVNLLTKKLDWFESNLKVLGAHIQIGIETPNDSIIEEEESNLNTQKKKDMVESFMEKINDCYIHDYVLAFDGDTIEFILSKFAHDEELLEKIFENTLIYGRTNPYQKKIIVKYYKIIKNKKYFTVGFIGDGANDSEALHEAHIGLSLGNELASMVADFYTEEDKIDKIKTISIEGKYSLVISIQILYYFSFILILDNLSVIVIGYQGLTYTSYEFATRILYYIPAYLIMMYVGSSGKMSGYYPKESFLNPYVFKPFLITLIFGIMNLYLLLHTILSDDSYKRSREILYKKELIDSYKHYFIPNKIFSWFWLLLSSVMIWAVSVNKPFNKPIGTSWLAIIFSASFFIYNSLKLFACVIDNYYWDLYLTKIVQWPNLTSRYAIKFFFLCSFNVTAIILCYRNCISYYWQQAMREEDRRHEDKRNFDLIKA